jgi:MurNAc alpha-1-phosphate uridylyltransferase
MRAMILAAGRGKRMRDLTIETPKPLLRVGGRYLIEYAILHIKQAGISEIVINVSYQAEQIKAALGDGARYGVAIHFSEEKEPLETGGGIVQALSLLDDKPFLVHSCDIISAFPLVSLPKEPIGLGHVVMVDNPEYHLEGDFGLREGVVDLEAQPTLTFANISVFRPAFFADCEPEYFRLTQLLMPAISKGQVTGEYYRGSWFNIGTPEALDDVNRRDSLLAHSI